MQIPVEMTSLLEGGVATWLTMCDDAGVPQISRVMGVRVGAEGRSVGLFLPSSQPERAVGRFAKEQQVAVSFCRVTDYRAIQIKGTVLTCRAATQDDHARLQRYHQDFSAACLQIGLTREKMDRLCYWPSVELEISVRQIYGQTPGEGAGALWR